jgi:drug/metabolite transporter (DMT)-like permease
MPSSTLVWLTPTLAALFSWGIAQGLVKKYIGEVPPARFCLFFAVANAAVNLLFAFALVEGRPPLFAEEGRTFLQLGFLAYVLDGVAWIFYYQSIVFGPISIVGTLSAAYPALTVVFARLFLDERLTAAQYAGVVAVIAGCLLLAYSPPDPKATRVRRRWIPLAGAALLIWGINGTIVKHAYAFPNAHEGNMAICIAAGGLLTLGVYGALRGRGGGSVRQWAEAFVPMAVMALGGLFTAIAYKYGPASLVSPLSGAYPIVTLAFAGIVLKERPAGPHWIGIALIFFGIGCVTSPDWLGA